MSFAQIACGKRASSGAAGRKGLTRQGRRLQHVIRQIRRHEDTGTVPTFGIALGNEFFDRGNNRRSRHAELLSIDPARWQALPGGDRLPQDEAFQLAGKLAVKRLAIGAVEA
jgi:hypothetical protein